MMDSLCALFFSSFTMELPQNYNWQGRKKHRGEVSLKHLLETATQNNR